MKFTSEHEWLTLDGKEATVGITEYAVSQLGDIVFVELPEVGAEITVDEEISVVESVKAASDICAPADGRVTAVNEELVDNPGLVNDDPLGTGWFFKMELNDLEDFNKLMDADEYNKLIG